ncbi:MAG: PCI domain-containing protein [Thermoplasmatota archaeon]
MRSKILVGIGILLGLVGLFFFGVSLDAIVDPPPDENEQGEEVEGDSSTGVCMMVMCVPIFWIPAGFLLYFGLEERAGSGLDDVASLLRSYEQISIEDAAEILNLSERGAEKKIHQCIDRGMVQGKVINAVYYSPAKLEYLDRRTDWIERLKDVADVLIAYRRVQIKVVSEKIGQDMATTEKLILECLEEGLVKGYLSTKQHVFYTQEYLEQLDDARVGWTCDKCGAQHDEVLLPGDYGRCTYCGSISKAKGISISQSEIERTVEAIEL